MTDDRKTVYRFDHLAGALAAAEARAVAIRDRGLAPVIVLGMCDVRVTLPPGEVEKFHALQRAEPQTFGEC